MVNAFLIGRGGLVPLCVSLNNGACLTTNMGGQHELIAFTFILVYGVSSLPWTKPQSSTLGSSSLATKPSEPKSPPGGWARDKRPQGNNSRASPGDDGGIVFPNDNEDKRGDFIPKIGKKNPECAKGSTFCENIDGYPSAYIEGILKNSALEFRGFFGNDYINDSTIAHRIDNTDENQLCPSSESIVYPQTALNKDQKWLYIINQGEYVQGVRVEKCVKQGESQPCDFTQGFPFGYRTYCKQKYIYRQLLALNENGQKIMDSFEIPACCACMVVSDGSLRSRLGAPGLKSSLWSTKSSPTTTPTTPVPKTKRK